MGGGGGFVGGECRTKTSGVRNNDVCVLSGRPESGGPV